MKKVLTILFILILAFAISCSSGSDDSSSDVTPTPPEETTTPTEGTAPDGFDPSSETMEGIDIPNDETETSSTTTSTGDVNGQSTSVDIPNLSTMGSVAAKMWMHSNLPGFGPHFKNWLNANGYSDLVQPAEFGSSPGFGGFRANHAPMGNKPIVILVHGNGSKAQGSSVDNRGWFDTYKALREAGWNNSEIYAVNFLSSTSAFMAAMNDHRYSNVNRVRRFIKAVYAYINQFRPNTKINIIGHSLGVTVSRAALADTYNSGSNPLWNKVDKFISIAGANSGIMLCGMYAAPLLWNGYTYYHYGWIPTCSMSTGFALPVPHKVIYGTIHSMPDLDSVNMTSNLVVTDSYSWWNPTGYFKTDALVNTSYFIGKVNKADKQFLSTGPAGNVKAYVIMSTLDEVVGIKNTIHGLRWWSAKLKGSRGTAIYSTMGIGHFGAKSKTTDIQIQMLLGQYSGKHYNP
jgi:hypothetical protein